MSKYTTGEMAKLCNVSVRTVQYYDSRNILVPSELSEGGRRLYTEEDLQKLKIICFLREIDLPINSIGELLSEEDPGSVISLLLEQQEGILREELKERQNKLNIMEELKRELKNVEHFSVESIADIAHVMETKKKLKKLRVKMLIMGIGLDIIEVSTFVLGVLKGIWWPFAVGMCLSLGLGFLVAKYYMDRVEYICPKCHGIFRPKYAENLFANHTPNTRKLTCVHCGHKGFCVEIYGTSAGKAVGCE